MRNSFIVSGVHGMIIVVCTAVSTNALAKKKCWTYLTRSVEQATDVDLRARGTFSFFKDEFRSEEAQQELNEIYSLARAIEHGNDSANGKHGKTLLGRQMAIRFFNKLGSIANPIRQRILIVMVSAALVDYANERYQNDGHAAKYKAREGTEYNQTSDIARLNKKLKARVSKLLSASGRELDGMLAPALEAVLEHSPASFFSDSDGLIAHQALHIQGELKEIDNVAMAMVHANEDPSGKGGRRLLGNDFNRRFMTKLNSIESPIGHRVFTVLVSGALLDYPVDRYEAHRRIRYSHSDRSNLNSLREKLRERIESLLSIDVSTLDSMLDEAVQVDLNRYDPYRFYDRDYTATQAQGELIAINNLAKAIETGTTDEDGEARKLLGPELAARFLRKMRSMTNPVGQRVLLVELSEALNQYVTDRYAESRKGNRSSALAQATRNLRERVNKLLRQ